jgi:aminoglycoside phosphotransferase (APT) family kinase protein
MTPSTEDRRFEQLARRITPGSTLLRRWRLHGGVSARVTALEIERADGQTQKLIVRQHGPVDLRRNPQIAADEFALLQILSAAGIAAPRPYYLDRSGEIVGTPAIVVEYIEGQPSFAPDHVDELIPQLAEQLSHIHALDRSKVDLSFLPDQARIAAQQLSTRPAALDDSLDEGRIRDTLEAVWPLPQHNRSVLLHGDFWPGNILWRDRRLAAVIDWEDANVGDPLADLANSRLEIAWTFGGAAMELFTQQYLSLAAIDTSNLAYWDLYAALRPAFKIADWAADPAAEQRMRQEHRWFITQAFQTIARS